MPDARKQRPPKESRYPHEQTMAVTTKASHRQIRADLFTNADEGMRHPTSGQLLCCNKELDEEPEAHRGNAATRKAYNRRIGDAASLGALFHRLLEVL